MRAIWIKKVYFIKFRVIQTWNLKNQHVNLKSEPPFPLPPPYPLKKTLKKGKMNIV